MSAKPYYCMSARMPQDCYDGLKALSERTELPVTKIFIKAIRMYLKAMENQEKGE